MESAWIVWIRAERILGNIESYCMINLPVMHKTAIVTGEEIDEWMSEYYPGWEAITFWGPEECTPQGLPEGFHGVDEEFWSL